MFDTEKRWWISNQEAIYQKPTCHGGNEMMKMDVPKVLTSFINCLSVIGENSLLLYKALPDKIELPL